MPRWRFSTGYRAALRSRGAAIDPTNLVSHRRTSGFLRWLFCWPGGYVIWLAICVNL